jgi:hypothetical protein
MDEPLANLYLGEGWSPPAGEAEGSELRYATRTQPLLLADIPSGGARVVLEWGSPLGALAASVNGASVRTQALDAKGLRWALDVPTGVGDRPVDRVLLRLPGTGVAAGEVLGGPGGADGIWPVGATGASLAGDVSLLVRSAGQEVGDFAHIWLNGVDVASGERGYNLAAIDAEGRLVGSETFDTLAPPEGPDDPPGDASREMAAWLRSWSPGTLIAGAVADEASLQLGQEAVDALREIGVATDLRGKFRWSHAFIGATGATGAAVEDAALLRPAVVALGAPVDGPVIYGQLRAIEIGGAEGGSRP